MKHMDVTPYHDQPPLHLESSRSSDTADWGVTILPYAPLYRLDFKRLNLEWITAYFSVEEIDTRMFSDPETYYLKPGGAIFFAELCGDIVGTIGLLKHPDGKFELSKMGVTRLYRGMGIGRQLAQTALHKAKSLGATSVFLETHSKLLHAVRLYKKLGFCPKPFPNGCSDRYKRADTYMELEW